MPAKPFPVPSLTLHAFRLTKIIRPFMLQGVSQGHDDCLETPCTRTSGVARRHAGVV